jgi:uroporphyrinogen-III synthase
MVDKTVVITRPTAQALPLAQQLAACGRQYELFPLLEILPLDDLADLDAALAGLHNYALVAFVSPNAIDAVFNRLPSWPTGVRIGVMGAGSRAALAAHGIDDGNADIISPADPERSDSETLLAVLDLQALSKQKVLIIRGESGRELLAEALRAAGIEVDQLAAYRRVAPDFTEQRQLQLSRLLTAPHDWIITSSEGLRILSQWANQLQLPGAVAKMQQQHLVVPHVRIAETAKKLGFQSITLTGSGDERLLVALQS